MPIVVTCPCGKKLSVKDELAGKRVKCPACQSPLAIPKPKDEEASSDDAWDLEDSAEDDDDGSARRGKRSSGSRRSAANEHGGRSERGRKAKGGKKPPSRSQNSWVIGLSVGGGVLVVALLAWMLWPEKKAENIAANPGGDAAATPGTATTTTATPATTAATNPSGATQVGQLPRAMTQLPDWLVQDAPFDVKQFWITVPPAENAAPLYLDALYEFSPHMEACFPPEVRTQRTAAAKARYDRSYKLQLDWDAYPTPKRDPAERDAVLQEHVIAFQKLAEAQKRPRCVFDVGWDVPSMALPIQALRETLRVAKLQVERDIERGDFDAAVRLTGSMLRLSRDLRPRTPLIFQFIGDALDAVSVSSLVIPVLKSPGLKINQCDELLRLLAQHEAALRSVDPFLTSLRGDYLYKRMLLHDVQQQTGEFAESRFQKAFGTTNETRGAALMSALNGDAAMSATFGTQPPNPGLGKMLDVVLRGMKPADFDANAAHLKEKYQLLTDSMGQPYAARASAFKVWNEKHQQEMQSQFADIMPPPKTPPEQMASLMQAALEKKLAEGTLRGPIVAVMLSGKFENDMGNENVITGEVTLKTRLQATMALIALRRWYGTHANPPPDIATMCREAGLPDAPREFFAEGPLRMVTFATDTPIQHPYQKDLKGLAGETVIYSVGPDGVDDKALKEYGQIPNRPGDWLFRLEIPQSAIPVTPAPPAAPIAVSAATPTSPGGGTVGSVAGSIPRLPDAVTQAPAWLVGNAPFDVVQYFEAPPADQNAAPLYLDAIAEFASDLQKCFLADPHQTQRFHAVTERMQRYNTLSQQPRTAQTAAQWDALLRDYEVGFQKLTLAQQKPKCVFETGIGLTAQLPHAQGARQIFRMADQRVRRDLENGNFDRALQSIEICLRLGRDLRPRGPVISQLVSMALVFVSMEGMIPRVITTPGVKREHCDRLLALLKQHEAEARDLFVEGTKSDYVWQRVTLREIQTQTGAFSPEGRRQLKQDLGTKDDSIGAILVAAFNFGSGEGAKVFDAQQLNALLPKLDERQEITGFDESYRDNLNLAEKPYRERFAATQQFNESLKQKPAVLVRMLQPATGQFRESITRHLTKLNGTQALVALRRWQLTHTEPPRDLAQVMTDAGVNTVPRDDYGDAPLKLATVKGKLVVYSIGPDGKDDGGAVAWNPSVPKGPGDLLFQLTPPPQ